MNVDIEYEGVHSNAGDFIPIAPTLQTTCLVVESSGAVHLVILPK
jgi:hypothetical protein